MTETASRVSPVTGSFWKTVVGGFHLTHPFPMIMNALPAGMFMYLARTDVGVVRWLNIERAPGEFPSEAEFLAAVTRT